MKIVRINPLQNGTGGKTAAFFDIQTDDGIVIKGFRLINGANGLFISSPNDKGKDGNYYDNVILPKEMRDKLQNMAIDEYNK